MRVKANRGRFSIAISGERGLGSARCLKSHLDQKIIEFLREYFNALISFTAQYTHFKNEEHLQFTDVDSLVENHVFYVREFSMALFHEENPCIGHAPMPHEKLLQLIIGSIFQELLRLKQYLYILETHQAQVAALEQSLETRYFLLRHGRALVQEAEMKLPSLMEELRELWEEANTFLHQWLPQFSENRVILRFLFRNQILIDRAYGYRGFENLQNYLFDHGPEDGYYRMGMDYYRSSHRGEAVDCFNRLLDIYENNKHDASPLSASPRLPKGTRTKRLKEILKAGEAMFASLPSKADEEDLLLGLSRRLETHLQNNS